jgi:protein ImuB
VAARPLAVAARVKSALRLTAVDRLAEARGLRTSMALADARAQVPDLLVRQADEAADRALLEAVADWCDRFTPLVALDPPHALFLDITGCAHLFGGEAALRAELLARLAASGLEARAAIASAAGAAWVAAHHGGPEIIAAGGEATALATLPLTALRLEADEVALLGRLGLKRMGQLAHLPRAPLAARFGARLMRRLDQALGRADEPLSPRRPAPEIFAERRFADPIADAGTVDATIRSLAAALGLRLERRGAGARALELALFRADGGVARAQVGTARPVRDAGLVAALFAERLTALGESVEGGFGFDMVRLAVVESEPCDARQIDLVGEAAGAADLGRLYDLLGARLGLAQVTRLTPVDSHIPERACQAVAVAAREEPSARGDSSRHPVRSAARSDALQTRDPVPLPVCRAETARHWVPDQRCTTSCCTASGMTMMEAAPPPERPLTLFARPEPVEVIAQVPEGPPLRFRWRRVLYQVARAEGPERIAPEWWRDDAEGSPTRDYYRVEDVQGRRFWLYRAGLYGRETDRPAWFMHGLFA